MPADFYDIVAEAIKSERIWLPGEITPDGMLRNIQQVTIENKGAPQGKGIFLSRRKAMEYEEQTEGTFKHNEVRHTLDLSLEAKGKGAGVKGKNRSKIMKPTWASGKPQEIVADDTTEGGGVVFMKRIGAYAPKYKIVQRKTTQKFFRSLEIARQVNQTRSGSQSEGALVNVGSGANIADSSGFGGKL
jgi:hypothetical protein